MPDKSHVFRHVFKNSTQKGQQIPVYVMHMIFDIKVKDFRSKARHVAEGHMTKAPTTVIHAGVVSRKTVRIALMIATLNDLEV